jgi:hypothetical protein
VCFPAAWAILWIGGALLQLLPASTAPPRCTTSSAHHGVPSGLATHPHLAAAVQRQGGYASFIALVALMAVVSLAGLVSRPWRTAAAAEAVSATTFWVLGQIGQLSSGQLPTTTPAP